MWGDFKPNDCMKILRVMESFGVSVSTMGALQVGGTECCTLLRCREPKLLGKLWWAAPVILVCGGQKQEHLSEFGGTWAA